MAVYDTLTGLLGNRREGFGEAVIRVLAWLAWADGTLQAEESEILESLVRGFKLGEDRQEVLLGEIQKPPPVGETAAGITDDGEKKLLLGLAHLLTSIDRSQSHEEVVAIANLSSSLGLDGAEAQKVLKDADALSRMVHQGNTTVDRALKLLVSGITTGEGLPPEPTPVE